MRSAPTDAEHRLWQIVRAHRFAGHKFRRQVPIDSFIVDFLCPSARLIVELDGGQHAQNADADAKRTKFLESHGYRVVLFWNNEVLENIEGVVASIEQALADRPSPSTLRASSPPASGRGKLSYKDQRDLDRLPGEIERLEASIATDEEALHDPELFTRDPKRFAELTERIARHRAEVEAAELRWLEVAEMAEALTK